MSELTATIVAGLLTVAFVILFATVGIVVSGMVWFLGV